MAEFSGGAAIASGLRLVGRRPGAVLAWGMVYVLLAIVPQLAMLWPMLPDMLVYYKQVLDSVQAGGALPEPSEHMLRVQAQTVAYQPPQILLGIAAMAVVSCAIYRSVLEPEKTSFASLRLGIQELWVGLVMVVFYVLMTIATVGAVVPVMVAGTVAGAVGGASWSAGLLVFLAACGAVALVIWVALRLSLAAPLSFSQRGFRLFESWALTRGQGWRLFAVVLALACIMIVLEMVLAMVAQAFGAGAVLEHLDEFRAFLAKPPADWLARAAPWIAGLTLLYTVILGLTFTIWTTPFAEIYRELSKTGGPMKVQPKKPG